MRFVGWACLSAAFLALIGCENNLESVATRSEGGSASANPIENYKDQRMREAMRGLNYESGLVTLTQEAAQISKTGSEADGARLAAAANEVFRANDFPASIAAFTKAVIVAPGRAATYLGLSQALIAKGRSREAEAAVRTSIKLAPRSIDAKIALAKLVDMSGEATTTIAAWNEVLALDPDVAEAHGRIAIATYYQGDTVGALRLVRECERLGGQVPSQFKDLLLTETRP